jgi:hypothetical protein
MYINDYELRKKLLELLKTRTKNEIVQSIKANGFKFHQFQIDKFLLKKDVNISTLKKIEKYVLTEEYKETFYPSY